MAKKFFEDGKEVANFEADFLPSDLPKEEEKEDEEQSRAEKSAMEFLKRVAPKVLLQIMCKVSACGRQKSILRHERQLVAIAFCFYQTLQISFERFI